MYFCHIATLSDARDFVSWLNSSRRLSFGDSVEFSEWLASQSIYPLCIYLDGATYTFNNPEDKLYFICGFEAALNLRENNE